MWGGGSAAWNILMTLIHWLQPASIPAGAAIKPERRIDFFIFCAG